MKKKTQRTFSIGVSSPLRVGMRVRVTPNQYFGITNSGVGVVTETDRTFKNGNPGFSDDIMNMLRSLGDPAINPDAINDIEKGYGAPPGRHVVKLDNGSVQTYDNMSVLCLQDEVV
jgi:hypothetical protein